jgi:hypothetical protein
MNELQSWVDQQIPNLEVYFHMHDDDKDTIMAFNQWLKAGKEKMNKG